MGEVIYSLGVKVYPDTRNFNDHLRKFLKRVEERNFVAPRLVLSDENKRDFRLDYKRLLNRLNSGRGYELNPKILPSLDDGKTAKIREQLENLSSTVDVTADTRPFERSLELLELHAQHGREVSIGIALDSDDLDYQIDRVDEELDRVAKDREATINVDVDKGVAQVKLAALARPRTVDVKPVINKKYLAFAEATLARLSGFRFAKDFTTDAWNFLKDFDKHAPKIALTTTALAGLTAGVTNLTAGTVTLLGSLGKFGSFLTLAPGLLASAGIGVTTMVIAFKDADKYVGSLGKKFSALRDTIGSNFWRDSVAPLHEIADRLIPQLNTHLGESARLLGANFTSLFQQLSESLGDGVIDTLFNNLNASISALQPGLDSLVHSFVSLGVHGSPHLVELNTWLSKILVKFSNWVEQSGKTGKFDKWIKDATETAKQFGRALLGTGEFLSKLTGIAREAGVDGLSAFERTVSKLNDVLDKTETKLFLTDLFAKSREAMDLMSRGLDSLMDSLLRFGPTLNNALTFSGETIKNLLTGVGKVLEDSSFQRGVNSLFKGVSEASGVLLADAPTIGRVLGSVGEIVGNMLPVLAEWVGLISSSVAPWLERLAKHSKSWADRLLDIAESPFADALKNISELLSPLAPVIAGITLAIGAWGTAMKIANFAKRAGELWDWVKALGAAKTASAGVDLSAGIGGVGKPGKPGKFGGVKGGGGLIGLAAAVIGAPLAAGGIESLTNWARGVDGVADSYSGLNVKVKQLSKSGGSANRLFAEWSKTGGVGKNISFVRDSLSDIAMLPLGGVGVAFTQWSKTDYVQPIRNLKDAVTTLDEANQSWVTWAREGVGSLLGGYDLTVNKVGTLRENMKNLDSVLSETARTNLPEFVSAWRTLGESTTQAEFSKLLKQMPELKTQLGDIATQMGVAADASNLFKIANGNLVFETNQWGQTITRVLSPAQAELVRHFQASKDRLSEIVAYSPAVMTALDNIGKAYKLPIAGSDLLKLATGELRIAYDEFGNATVESVTNSTMTVEEKIAAQKKAQEDLFNQFPEYKAAWEQYAQSVGLPAESTTLLKLATGELAVELDKTTGKVDIFKANMQTAQDAVRGTEKGYVAAIDGMEGATSTGFDNITRTITQATDTIAQKHSAYAGKFKLDTSLLVSDTNTKYQIGGREWARTMQSNWSHLVNETDRGGRSTVNSVAGTASGIKAQFNMNLASSGASIMESFANGISSRQSWAVSVASTAVAAIRALFPNSPAKTGPFSGRGWVTFSGESVGKAFAEGIASSSGDAVAEAEKMAYRARQAIENQRLNTSVNTGGIDFTTPRTMILHVGEREFTAYVDSRAENVVSSSSRGNVRAMAGL